METRDLAYVHQYEPGLGDNQNTTLLLLHGMGGNETALRGLGRMLLPHAAQLRPRGNVTENGMPRFFRRLAEGVLDVDDLKQRTNELVDFVQKAQQFYGFDKQKIIAVGFSNGANITASMLLMYPQVLRAALLLHPIFPFMPENPPELSNKPVFIGAGRSDPLVPIEQTEQLAALLRRVGANVDVFWHNGAHTINIEEVRAAKNWLENL